MKMVPAIHDNLSANIDLFFFSIKLKFYTPYSKQASKEHYLLMQFKSTREMLYDLFSRRKYFDVIELRERNLSLLGEIASDSKNMSIFLELIMSTGIGSQQQRPIGGDFKQK